MFFYVERDFGDRKIRLETGKLASQANSSVTVSYGDTVLLATVCIASEPREGVDFLPLTIDYEERLYAAGKIPGGFIRREGRPSEAAILAARLTDRPIRPLLPKDWRHEIQVIITVLSVDRENDPDILAVVGASAALALSGIPFEGPVSCSRVGYIDGELVLNPTFAQLEFSQLDIEVASTKKEVIMLEAGAKEAPEDIVFRAIQFAHKSNQVLIKLQEEFVSVCGKTKTPVSKIELPEALVNAVSAIMDPKLSKVFTLPDKSSKYNALDELKAEVEIQLSQEFPQNQVVTAYETKLSHAIRQDIIINARRPSGRGIKEIRQISCEVGVLPRVHGSALFSRGETQVLTITTLGSLQKEQQLDGLGVEETKRFMHHYNFPPFSTGEVKRIGGTSRRETGHGALAERSLQPVVPLESEDFPYTIRLVSEVLSSNGSTSMASVCASSLSLMDAGVPIKRAVAGISIGLVSDDEGAFITLTDIEGLEDFNGDMDFKVAGTTEGVTAIQLDTKLKGLPMAIIEKTLSQAREARLTILDQMNKTIAQSRPELSRYAPRMHKIKIDSDKIGAVIGSGGKTIRAIQEETGTTIDIQNDGTIFVGAVDAESAKKAVQKIEELTKDIEVGAVYSGKVARLMNFGAFVEILPGREGLVHISEMANRRIEKVEDVVKIGDVVKVKVIEIDNQGRINLSMKSLLPLESRQGERGYESRGDRFSRQRPPIRRRF
jgi:polyribonucleotide nucleotidyltransferase